VSPRWVSSLSSYTLAPTSLPFFLNTNEWNLGPTQSTGPTLQMLLFVPAPQHSPLVLLDGSKQPIPSNAFAVENWGGVYIHTVGNETGPVHLGLEQLQPACDAILGLLCKALSCPHMRLSPASTALKLLYDGASTLAMWEVDAMVRRRGLAALAGTRDKLVALMDLVEGLPNVVVEDEVGEQAIAAIANYHKAVLRLSEGRLRDALGCATRAHELATDAFHHPTMVSLLYFPDDHKLAVYVPLLLPMFVPLISNFIREGKLLRASSKETA